VKTRVEGAYTYYCPSCETFFAVVSRLSVKQDKAQELTCPKCRSKARLYGEGHVTYELYIQRNQDTEEIPKLLNVPESTWMKPFSEYPDVLTAEHVAEILSISIRYTYEIMEWKGFPLIRIGKNKRVRKDKFIEWLEKQEK
jgi:excisionase family DNA binding protein